MNTLHRNKFKNALFLPHNHEQQKRDFRGTSSTLDMNKKCSLVNSNANRRFMTDVLIIIETTVK